MWLSYPGAVKKQVLIFIKLMITSPWTKKDLPNFFFRDLKEKEKESKGEGARAHVYKSTHKWEGQRKERESEADSALSIEPDTGFDLKTLRL